MKRTTAMAFTFGALLVGGCAQSTGFPPASQLKEGLNVFSADELAGVSGALVKDGRTVYFETRRGIATPEFIRASVKDAPQFEIDVRYLDKDGHMFLSQMGGDEFIDKSWYNVVEHQVDPQARLADARLAREVGAQLAARSLGSAVSHELAAISGHAVSLREEKLVRADLVAAAKVAPTTGYSNTYVHEVDLSYECLATCLAQHSSTRGDSYQSGYWNNGTISCNHGDCENSGNMTADCWWDSAANRQQYVVYQAETSSSPGTHNGGCSTGYNWTSVGGTHNCNDDSELQINNIINNKTYSSSGPNVCNDGNIHATRPYCKSTM